MWPRWPYNCLSWFHFSRPVAGRCLQDTLASLILSECAYKKVELEQEELAAKISEFANEFPPGWIHLESVQLSLDNLPQQ